jgi:hypothetical protein
MESNKYQVHVKSIENQWVDGVIYGYRFQAKVYDAGSKCGINNGRVSKLWIFNEENCRTIVNYDRGWDAEPTDDEQKEVLQALLEHLENMPTEGR